MLPLPSRTGECGASNRPGSLPRPLLHHPDMPFGSAVKFVINRVFRVHRICEMFLLEFRC